ncbi:LLM class F420-dependent oxidoreductase [Dictyobacter arantiisoli]|uniref:LLM class F420-dependent oxidoreductase n=1 Tax=Dictyobacter arantiisoli TaxID=2014874 RepID=A0A5A5TGG9_9CHLR|nr:LLM class F420-dependent oxidoreductase [Dictyobacter arantiisoli]GCF10681.1 LLM class F420-dependent oxidoreductase [Dictyobacter arantiisoli]
MRLGLQVPSFTWSNGQSELGDTFAMIAERAERAGLHSLWVMDHFFQIHMVGPAENEMLEGWSALAFAAGRTNRIKLGTLVTGITYRHPGVLIKTATTLDVLSHGRAYLGIGAAWNEQEHKGLGIPFPPLAERFERLEETLKLAHQMWAGDDSAFTGKYYNLERPLNSPLSVQKPHPPIMVGGGGEKKTLRLVAQYGDACNLFARIGKEELQRKLGILQEHCAQLGRPYAEIEKTTLDSIQITKDGHGDTLSPNAAIDLFGSLAELGIDQALFSLRNANDIEAFDLLATRVIPEVEKIKVAGR